MEEDIKVLEEFIEEYNASYPEEKEWVAIYPNQIQAIENLIVRNKELKKLEDVTIETLKDTNYIHNNYIPKSKARKKIEEAKGKIEYYKKCANIAKDRVKKRLMCDQINELRTAIKYFEELLQEGDDK